MPGQTIEDIALAEARFLEKVISLHPDADGKPCVIGNCQARWAMMMLAAFASELFGRADRRRFAALLLGGMHGQNPMRYSGGLMAAVGSPP